MSRARISSLELGIVTFMLLVGAIFTEYSGALVDSARQSGWLCPLVALIPTLAIVLTIAWFAARFPGMSTVQILVRVLGKFLGKLSALVFAVILLAAAAMPVRTFGAAILTGAQRELPISVVVAVLVALQVYQVYWGLEVIARVAAAFLPYIITSIAGILIGTVGYFKPHILLPVFAATPTEVGRGAWYALGYLSEVLFVSIMLNRIRDAKNIRRSLVIGTTLAAVPSIAVTAWSIGIFGIIGTTRLVMPTLELARLVSVGETIQRLEAVFVVFWLLATVVRVGIFMWTASEGTAEALNITNYRVLLPIIGLLVYLLAMLPRDYWMHRTFVDFYATRFPAVALGFLLLMVIVTLIRRVKGETADASGSESR